MKYINEHIYTILIKFMLLPFGPFRYGKLWVIDLFGLVWNEDLKI